MRKLLTGKSADRIRRIQPLCDKLDKIQAEKQDCKIIPYKFQIKLSQVIRFLMFFNKASSLKVDKQIKIKTLTHRWGQHWSTEPDGISLHMMRDHLNINWFWLKKKEII